MIRSNAYVPVVDVKVRQSYLQHFEIALLNFDKSKREEQLRLRREKEKGKGLTKT
jgi:hypothetical protein